MIDPKPLAGLALCGLLLAACASEEAAEGHRVEGRRHGQGGMAQAAPVISADVFLLLPYDGDHDHRLTKSELNAAIAGSWREVAGSRSAVRLAELQDWFVRLEGAAATPFNPMEFAADNGDSVSRDEFAKALTRRFDALDKNKDGVLDPSEFMIIPRFVRQEEGGGMEGGGMEGGGMHRRRGGDDGGAGGPY
jgi:hypothetical protein